MQRFLHWLFMDFGFRGGVYLIAGVLLLLASIRRGRARVILCVFAWLTILAQAWWLFMIMGLEGIAHHYPANDTFDLNVMRIGGTLLVVVIAGFWSYCLFRKPKTQHEIISVPYEP